MWPFSLLKKLTQDPPVGQPRGDYIGCYLLGTEAPGQAGPRVSTADDVASK